MPFDTGARPAIGLGNRRRTVPAIGQSRSVRNGLEGEARRARPPAHRPTCVRRAACSFCCAACSSPASCALRSRWRSMSRIASLRACAARATSASARRASARSICEAAIALLERHARRGELLERPLMRRRRDRDRASPARRPCAPPARDGARRSWKAAAARIAPVRACTSRRAGLRDPDAPRRLRPAAS